MAATVNEPRYTQAVHSLLNAIDQRDATATVNTLNEALHLMMGTIPYAPVRYVGEPSMCTICQSNITTGDTVVYVPCGHVFHRDCAPEWFRENVRCPNCNSF